MPDCPATMPLGLGTTLLSKARFAAALSSAIAPVSAATIHPGPPASQPRIQQYIIACSRAEASSLHRSRYCWEIPVADAKTKHGILATALWDCTTT